MKHETYLPKALAVVGPTAAGKTKLGVQLAVEFNGEIVSADSRQVYRHLDISTGKDKNDYIVDKKRQTTKDKKNTKIKYHLIDILEPDQEFNVTDYQKKAFKAIDDILLRKKTPILVGGSAFYLYAVAEGWEFPKIRKDAKFRSELDRLPLSELQNMLRKIDPAAYKIIDINNPRRLGRAIEVCVLSGKDFAEYRPKPKPRYNFLYLGITFPNETLKQRIKKRLKERLEEGMVEEIEKIIAKKQANYSDLEKMGLEPRFISFYLQKKINKKQLEELLLKNIYSFAKRQMTWLRKDKRINWVTNADEAIKHVDKFLSL